MVLIKLMLLLFSIWTINGARFRFEYTYYGSVEGWLKLHLVPATWKDAMLLCHAEGAVLASPINKELQAKMLFVAKDHSISSIFTGVHTTFAKGVYASVEGVPLQRLPISWVSGEPDNYENDESCLAMQTSDKGNMKDVSCSTTLPFICYLNKTKSLNLNECGTHDSAYNLDNRTGKCYKFHRDGAAWHYAYMTCMAEGGHLAIINSDLESLVVKELYARNPDNVIVTSSRIPHYAHVGIQCLNGPWMTIHGETLEEAGYNTWANGEPNNGSKPEGELCGAIHRNNGFYNDVACSWVLPFICEKHPESLKDQPTA